MPDFEPLPRRPRAPVFEPRTGDYAVVVGRAKHRRRRHLGTAGAGVAGIVAVVALSGLGGSGTFGLNPAPPAAGITAPTESPEPQESPAPEETAAPDPEEPGTSGSTNEEPGPGSGGDEQGDPDEVLIDPGPLGPGDSPRARPVFVRDDIAKMPTQVCDTDIGLLVPATGWCLHYDGPKSAQVGEPESYRLLACRHVGRGGATLTFDTEQQIDFWVQSDGGREEWRWSAGYPFPKRTNTVRVEDGRCARWTVVWDATGSDGELLRAGEYGISPYLNPSDWGTGTGPMGVSSVYSLTLRE